MFRLLLLLIVVFTGTSIAQEALSPESKFHYESYQQLFQYLINLDDQEKGTAVVNDLTIERDVATFHMKQGTLTTFKSAVTPIGIALFKGEGMYSAVPPTEIEQAQLNRFYKKGALAEPFDYLFLIYADSTLAELSQQLEFSPANDGSLKRDIEKCIRYLSDKGDDYFDSAILKTFFDGQSNDLFFAHVQQGGSSPFFFEINPFQAEEVRMLRRAETNSFYNIPEVICQFHRAIDYLAGIDLSRESRDPIRVTNYSIDSEIKGNVSLDFSAKATVDFTVRQDNQQWIYFRLFHELKVDSVFWEDGSPATYFKGDKNPFVWIRCDSTLMKKQQRQVTFYYHGDLLKRDLDARIYIRASTGWYPSFGSRKPATFHLKFRTPKKFPGFFAAGKKISQKTTGKVIESEWRIEQPANFASFNLGDFEAYAVKGSNPPAEVYAYKDNRAIKDVGADVANSLALFQEIFGPPPVDHFYATETPYSHGLAFKGLIHLSSSTFRRTNDKGYDELFRGHEVAHQWWGIAVDYATYHDRWISEAFSEYAGLKYMQTVLFKKNGTKKYFDILDDWRKRIIGNRKFLFEDGQEAGPIWLGHRTSTSSTAGDASLMIYQKGAWVLHMLRMMVIDTKNLGNESVFENLLKSFYTSYRGKKASTKDFQTVVEKHANMGMDWFFKQWIYGTDIPKYTYAFKTFKKGEGRFLVRCKVKMENASEDFQMPMLFSIDLGNNRRYVTRKMVSGPESTIDLLISPVNPKSVEFNYLHSVLCDAKKTKWWQ